MASSVFCGIGAGSAIAGHAYAAFGDGGLLGVSALLLAAAAVSLVVIRGWAASQPVAAA